MDARDVRILLQSLRNGRIIVSFGIQVNLDPGSVWIVDAQQFHHRARPSSFQASTVGWMLTSLLLINAAATAGFKEDSGYRSSAAVCNNKHFQRISSLQARIGATLRRAK